MSGGRPKADQDFRNRVCEAIEKGIAGRGWSKTEAARQLGVTRQSVHLYLKREVTPSPEVVSRAFKLFEIRELFYRGYNVAPHWQAKKYPRRVSVQRGLFDFLANQNLTVDVTRQEQDAVELRIRIPIAT